MRNPRPRLCRKRVALYMAILTLSTVFSIQCHAKDNTENTLVVRYPESEDDGSIYAKKSRYLISVLRMALEKSGEKFEMRKVVLPSYTGGRNIRNLEGKVYDLSWLNTTLTREEQLLPVRIPLFKGLIGWRLMFIRKQDRELFSSIRNLSDFKKLTAGQGHDWPDAEILRFNELKYFTSVNRTSYFKMLDHKRIDYYPRALVEIWYEQQLLKNKSIIADTNVLLRYPSAYYFFVRKEDSALAAVIETGLLNAYADGTFDKHFMLHYRDDIERAKISERTIIDIHNPNFPNGILPKDNRFWYQLN